MVTPPANGTVGISGTTATLAPLPGFEGADSFTVAAWDAATGLTSNLASFSVKVTAASRPQISSVVNAASFLSGAVAPGEIVTVYGTGLAGASPSLMDINSAGLVNRSLAGVRVLFDGLAAPVLYASAGQVNAIAPWGIAGKASTSVRAEYNGIQSAAVSVNVGAASPAVFAGAVLNQDFSVKQRGESRGQGLIPAPVRHRRRSDESTGVRWRIRRFAVLDAAA